MWFNVDAADLDFTERSPFRFENEAVVRCSPERLFDIWATGEAQERWFKDLRAIRWTSPEPHGVGATREVELATLTVKERFLAWDRGKRMAFQIYAITLPLVDAMVEDLQFTPLDGGRTRMIWRAHYRPALVMRLLHPLVRWNFSKLFSATCKDLARYAEEHP